jgi:hypothetical protein
MVVTWAYNAGTNTATASGAGSTNFAALVAADTAGGWGKFTADATGTQILCQAKIIAGDGTNALTWTDTNLQVTFAHGTITANYQQYFLCADNSTVTFGTSISATLKTSNDGCQFIFRDTTYHGVFGQNAAGTGRVMNLYSCSFLTLARETYVYCYRSVKMYNCQFGKGADPVIWANSGTGVDIYNLQSDPRYSTYVSHVSVYSTATYDKLFLFGQGTGLQTPSATDATVTNAFARGLTYLFGTSTTYSKNFYLVNCDSDNWALNWGATATGVLYRQYTFDLVLFGSSGSAVENATVTLKNADASNAFSVSTAADGSITQQTVSRGYYNKANGDTLQDYGPFTLTISKAGYMTYTHSGIVLDEKIDWRINLRAQLTGNADVGDVATGKTFYKDDADTQLTGTKQEPQAGSSGGASRRTRTKIVFRDSPVTEPALMATAVLLIQNRRLKRRLIQAASR